MKYKREECACFTGHRIVKNDVCLDQIDGIIETLLNRGVHVFLNGMALGFDTLCFKRLLVLKNLYPEIKIVACIPCLDQDIKFPKKNKIEYKKLLEYADEKIVISKEYNDYCMKERDRFMVDNSCVCISYLYKSLGGAYYTTKYAIENGLEVFYIK